MKNLIILISIVFLPLFSIAGNGTWEKKISLVNARAGIPYSMREPVRMNQDVKLVNKFTGYIFLDYTRKDRSDLAMNGASRMWRMWVNYKVEGNATVHQLKIGFEGNNSVYSDYKEVEVLNGGYRIIVESIQGEYSTNNGSSWIAVTDAVTSPEIPDDIDIRLELRPETVYAMDPNVVKDQSFLYFNSSTFRVNWSFVEGAELYDLEWVYIDKYSLEAQQLVTLFANPSSVNDLQKAFEMKSPARVRLWGTNYSLDKSYQEGTLYFRVRSVSNFTSNGSATDQVKTGSWNYFYNPDPASGRAANDVVRYEIKSDKEFEPAKNWLYGVSFAEAGKSVSSITYYDGSNRGRQNISYNNSDHISLVGESKFDREGRQTIGIVPAPVAGRELGYKTKFNMASATDVFDEDNFDFTNPVTPVLPLYAPTTGISGAAQYFSPNNQFTNDLFRASIPNANGYVFSQTIYRNDGSGRIERVGGIGEAFQASGPHATRMYYGTPTALELRRLFGENVSVNPDGYRKEMVQDPNKQLSVTYYDKRGNVIATGLAGNSPQNLRPIEIPATELVTTSLNDNNILIEDQHWVSEHTFLNALPSNSIQLYYDLTGLVNQINSTPILAGGETINFGTFCSSCQYDLKVEVLNPDNQPVAGSPFTGHIAAGGTCSVGNLPVGHFAFPALTLAEIGEYRIIKTLSIDKTSMQNAFQSQIQASGLNNPTSFVTDYVAGVDISGCFDKCEDYCEAMWKLDYIQEHPGTTKAAADAAWNALSSTAQKQALTTCMAGACNQSEFYDFANGTDPDAPASAEPQDLCYALKQRIYQQISPGGVFYDNPNSIYWEYVNDELFHGDGTGSINVNGESYTFSKLQDPAFFIPGMEVIMSKYHREYCHLTWCDDWLQSMNYSMKLNAEMTNAGWNGGASIYTVPYNTNITGSTDPFLQSFDRYFGSNTPPAGSPYLRLPSAKTLAQRVSGYLTIKQAEAFLVDPTAPLGCTGYTFPSTGNLADYTNAYTQCAVGQLAAQNPSIILTAAEIEEMKISIFKGLYDNIKEQMIEEFKLVNGCPYFYDDDAVFMGGMHEEQITNAATGVVTDMFSTVVCETRAWTNTQNWMEQLPVSCLAGLNLITINANETTVNNYSQTSVSNAYLLVGGATVDNLPEYFYAYSMKTCHSNTWGWFYDPTPGAQGNKPGEVEYEAVVSILANTPCEITAVPFEIETPETMPSGSGFLPCFSYGPPVEGGAKAQVTCVSIISMTEGIPVMPNFEADCIEAELGQGAIDATTIYNGFLNELQNSFLQSQKCFVGINENFRMTYSIKEYQYTLYYYDLAGNLVQTVPPQGVQVLTSAQVASNTNPAHTMETRYQYNGLNTLIAQYTPDGGRSDFYLDKLYRVRFSQNAQQTASKFASYLNYDDKGRVTEAGEVKLTVGIVLPIPAYLASKIEVADFPTVSDPNIRMDYTTTFYEDGYTTDAGIAALFGANGQENLRNSIGAVLHRQGDYNSIGTLIPDTEVKTVISYTYDAHKNVKRTIATNYQLQGIGQQHKVTDYAYDLISGNVNEVVYQKGKMDESRYRYHYDANNRLVRAFTSGDGIFWEMDSKYFYYLHGALARTETGHDQVQGTDYAYNLQGWLKGTNSTTLGTARDIGKDGYISGLNKNFGRDAIGFQLGYYANDYNRIGYTAVATEPFANTDALTTLNQNTDISGAPMASLYNGNITHMVTAIRKTDESVLDILGNNYQYDQLQRIRDMKVYAANGLNASNTFTGAALYRGGAYHSEYTFDKNGNFKTLQRNGSKINDLGATAPLEMDNFTYNYENGAGGYTTNPTERNRLASVGETVAAANYSGDIDAVQTANNYQYNLNGQLVKDLQEGIETIEWTVTGKVRRIKFTADAKNAGKRDLRFIYDPMDRRVAKVVYENTVDPTDVSYTYYSYDASGNPLMIYERKIALAPQTTTRNFTDKYTVSEQVIYGAARTGTRKIDELLVNATVKQNVGHPADADKAKGFIWAATAPLSFDHSRRKVGSKLYELSNHLGNVLAVITDRKLPIQDEPVLLSNDFSNGNNSFAPNTPLVLTLESGRLKVSNVGLWQNTYTEIPTVQGRLYRLKYTIDHAAMGEVTAVAYAAADFVENLTSSANGTYTMDFVATASNTAIWFESAVAGPRTFYLDDVSVREVPTILSTDFGSSVSPFIASSSGVGVTVALDAQRMKVTTTALYKTSFTVVTTATGKNYRLRFKTDILGSGAIRAVIYDNPTSVSFLTADYDANGTYTLNFTARSTSTLVWFESLVGGTRSFLIDNVSIEVLEPQVNYTADVVSYSDYEPYGAQLQHRHAEERDYRYGFNGMEADNELKGDGNSYTTEFRQYDPRIGRWMSLDPLMGKYAGMSPYVSMNNNPIILTDPLGLEANDWIGKKNDDGTTTWTFDKNVTSADQLPEGYTEFAINGTTLKSANGGYVRLGEGTYSNISETDFKASNGVFVEGYYYRVGKYGWEEAGMMYADAVSSEMAATANFIAAQMSAESVKEDIQSFSDKLMWPSIEAAQRQANLNYQMSTTPGGLIYQLSPLSAVTDVFSNVQEKNYLTAGGIALLEFTPFDEVGDLIRANKSAFRAFKREFGAAGPNLDWHHLVEQNPTNIRRFGVEAVQNSDNLIRLDRDIHHLVTGHYNSAYLGAGFSRNRDYVNSLSFAEQRAYALRILQQFNITH